MNSCEIGNWLKRALYEHGQAHDKKYADSSHVDNEKFQSLYRRYCKIEQDLFANELVFSQLPDFTDHGAKHTTNVQNICADLIPRNIKPQITDYEIFILLVSSLFHDIGMIVTKRMHENYIDIRLDHCNRSKEFILNNYRRFGFDKHEAEIIGIICLSHGLPDLSIIDEVYSLKGHKEIRVSLICAILRLADALDVTADRAPESISESREMPYENKQHWVIHQCISDVKITTIPSWDIIIFALLSEESLEPAIFRLRNSIQKELDTTSNILRSSGIFFKKIDLKLIKNFSKNYEKNVQNPFVLLACYDKHNACFFAGRDDETQSILDLICSRKLVLVIGESGVGKTSLVKAGILPKLRIYKKEEKFEIINFEFNGDPIENLIAELENTKNITTRSKDLITAIEQKMLPKTHIEAFSDVKKTKTKQKGEREGKVVKNYNNKMLIIGDHLEKMFTLKKSDDVRYKFVHQLSRVLASDIPVAFLFCIREDYLPDLLSLSQDVPEFYDKKNTFRLHRLDKGMGVKILEKASSYSERKLSNNLIEKVASDLCKEGDGLIFPPFLQIVGYKLYESNKKKVASANNEITEEYYESLGEVVQIVNQYLEGLLDQFKLEEKPIVGKILKTMVTEYYTKKRVTEKELMLALPDCSNIENLLQKLVNKRIVRRSLGSYELIHDFFGRRIIESIDERRFLSKHVRKAIEFIENNYYKTDLRSSDVANDVGVNQIHLAALFSEQLHCTINNKINEIRISNAKKILNNGLEALSDIAFKVGFGCLASFSRKFKELEKISPMQYRKILVNNCISRKTLSGNN